jgi:hypothetical protein
MTVVCFKKKFPLVLSAMNHVSIGIPKRMYIDYFRTIVWPSSMYMGKLFKSTKPLVMSTESKNLMEATKEQKN